MLDIYGMNIKIAGALGNFRIFVDDMAVKLKRGADEIASFDKRLASVGASIAQVQQADRRVRDVHRQHGAKVPERLDQCAGQMEQHLVGVSEMIVTMGEITHRVEDRVGAVLSAIQVADSTRQRIEHCVAIIEQVEAAQVENPVPPAALAHMAALVGAQIAATGAAFADEIDELQNSLLQLAIAGKDLNGLVDCLATADGTTSLRDLEISIVEIGPMSAQLHTLAESSARMSGEIGVALAELDERVESIDQIVRDVKEISINTRLLCRQQGSDGAAVAVIAVEIAAQARELNQQASMVADAIAGLETCNSRLGEHASSCIDEDLDGLHAAVMATLREAGEQSEKAIARGSSSGRKLIAQLDAIASGVGENLARDRTLMAASADFAAIAPAPLDDRSEAWLVAILPGIAARYTMAAEREVHARFLLPSMATAAEPASLGGDTDEDGLF